MIDLGKLKKFYNKDFFTYEEIEWFLYCEKFGKVK